MAITGRLRYFLAGLAGFSACNSARASTARCRGDLTVSGVLASSALAEANFSFAFGIAEFIKSLFPILSIPRIAFREFIFGNTARPSFQAGRCQPAGAGRVGGVELERAKLAPGRFAC